MAHAFLLGASSSITLRVTPGSFPKTTASELALFWLEIPAEVSAGVKQLLCSLLKKTPSPKLYMKARSQVFYNICICLKAVRREQEKESALS